MATTGVTPYRIKSGQSLQDIARDVYGSEDGWINLALFNQLDPPYIVEFAGSRGASTRATGTVLVSPILPATYPILVEAGTLFGTPVVPLFGSDITVQLLYQATQDASITTPAAVRVSVIAIYYGENSNASVGDVSVVIDQEGVVPPTSSVITVTNDEPITGGLGKRVLVVGEIILVPVGGDGGAASPQSSAVNYANGDEAFWTDRMLGSDISMSDPFRSVVEITSLARDISPDDTQDIRFIEGRRNLAQAITHRFSTPKGSLRNHPEYGSMISDMIGQGGILETIPLLASEAKDTLLGDPRITRVVNVGVTQGSSDTFYIDSDVETVDMTTPVSLNLVFSNGRATTEV